MHSRRFRPQSKLDDYDTDGSRGKETNPCSLLCRLLVLTFCGSYVFALFIDGVFFMPSWDTAMTKTTIPSKEVSDLGVVDINCNYMPPLTSKGPKITTSTTPPVQL